MKQLVIERNRKAAATRTVEDRPSGAKQERKMSKRSEDYVRNKGYREGRDGKDCRPPRGFIDHMFDAKQSSRENDMYRRSHSNGRSDRRQGR